MNKMFQPDRVRESKKHSQKILDRGLVLFFILIGTAFATRMIISGLDTPQAATHDGGKTIEYFEVPSRDGKSLKKVYPDSKEFIGLLREQKYQLVHIPSPATLNQIEGGETR